MMPRMGFRDRGIEPADGFTGHGFIVRPLVPSDVMLDHDAVMTSTLSDDASAHRAAMSDPAWKPFVQAFWKLKPPVMPSTSMTSPAK